MSSPKKCQWDGQGNSAYPPQSKCKNCGQFWFNHEGIPDCKMVEINTVFPVNYMKGKPISESAETTPKVCTCPRSTTADINFLCKNCVTTLIQSQQDEFNRTLNSGHKLYQIGKKDEQNRLVKAVEGKKKVLGKFISSIPDDTYNQALDDILQIIKQEI